MLTAKLVGWSPITRLSNNRLVGKCEASIDLIEGRMAERTGLEPATPGVTGRYSNQLNYRSVRIVAKRFGGWRGARTPDPRLVRAMLFQLSYPPESNDGAG